MKPFCLVLILVALSVYTYGQSDKNFNGLGVGMDNLFRLSNAKTRSISAENFTGEKGKGGMATEAFPASKPVI